MFTADEQPIVAHIWGNKPALFEQMSIDMKKLGFRGIDINMGCPAQNAAASGKGAGLIRHPEVAAEIIQAAKAGGLPVSVKTRLGYSKIDEWRGWLGHILKQDIANLSIHLRTKKEKSKVAAHWELIPEIKKLRDELAPNTLLTINGDIPDRATGLKIVEQYGVDGIMIGAAFSLIHLLSRKTLKNIARRIFSVYFFYSWIFTINIQQKPCHVHLDHFFAISKSMFVDLEAQTN